MKLTSTAFALVLATLSGGAFAQYGSSQPAQQTPSNAASTQPSSAPAPQIRPSAKALKALVELQTAVNANDTANIPAKLAAAQAVATTKEDRYLIARLQLKAAAVANDIPNEAAAVDALAASGIAPTADVASLYGALGGTYYKAKQYDQAVAAYQHQATLDPQTTDPLVMIAESRAAQGRPADAVSSLQRVIQASSAAGKKPDEAVYRRAVAIAYESKLPAAVDLARQWVTAYPSDTSWQNTIAIYRNLHPGDSANLIDIFRLASATNGMQQATDYEIYAAKAFDQANYGEVKAVIDAGIAAGKLKASDAGVAPILAAIKGKVPTATDLAAAEKGAAIPTAFLRVGDRYYGMGDYAKAAALYRTALAKGAEANIANLRLGEALARSGDKAGAAAALNLVSGPQSDLAKLWLLYAQRPA